MESYVKSLIDPFTTVVSQPKLLDGTIDRSAGVKFRAAGQITCKNDGTDTIIAVIPGISNNLSWESADATQVPIAYLNHVDTPAAKELILQKRLVGVGVKLSLINSALESEGYWEAARLPISVNSDFVTLGEDRIHIDPVKLASYASALPNYNSFQTGKLRDIHRYMFKLNSIENDHDFDNTGALFDKSWDVIVIRVSGRVSTASSSVLRYEIVSNQEIVYKEGTAVARLMGNSMSVETTQKILKQGNSQTPGTIISTGLV